MVHEENMEQAVDSKSRLKRLDIQRPVVWLAEYNACVHESGFEVLSVHRSEAGAQDALEKHKRARAMRNPQDWQQWRTRNVKLAD